MYILKFRSTININKNPRFVYKNKAGVLCEEKSDAIGYTGLRGYLWGATYLFKTPRRFIIMLRRTLSVEPIEPVEPVEPFYLPWFVNILSQNGSEFHAQQSYGIEDTEDGDAGICEDGDPHIGIA